MPSRPSEFQSQVEDMIVEDFDDVDVAHARSVENDRPRNGVSDTSDTESVNAVDDREGAFDIEGEEEIVKDIPEVAIVGVLVRARKRFHGNPVWTKSTCGTCSNDEQQ